MKTKQCPIEKLMYTPYIKYMCLDVDEVFNLLLDLSSKEDCSNKEPIILDGVNHVFLDILATSPCGIDLDYPFLCIYTRFKTNFESNPIRQYVEHYNLIESKWAKIRGIKDSLHEVITDLTVFPLTEDIPGVGKLLALLRLKYQKLFGYYTKMKSK